jgi:hypothetical protein
MLTVLACLFVLFAVDGFFRTRTLNDDSWTAEAVAKKQSRLLARLKPALWVGLAIVLLFFAWKFEW